MNTVLTKEFVKSVIQSNPWDLGNKVLYDLCTQYPDHKQDSVIIAKMWLIGRSYAAAIERRKSAGNGEFTGNDFYLEKVAPEIKKANIDDWLGELSKLKVVNKNNLPTVLSIHKKVTELFSKISGQEKRSLASKYLHFHFPALFYIYDSRAAKSVSKLSYITGRVGRSNSISDNEYRKFCEKCISIHDYVKKEFGINLTTRKLDKLLLNIDINA